MWCPATTKARLEEVGDGTKKEKRPYWHKKNATSSKTLLQHYQSNSVPVMFHNSSWSQEKLDAAMERDPHKSTSEHVEFLCKDFLNMIDKSQWILLPYDNVKELKGLRLSPPPPGVMPQRNRRPWWIGNYMWSEVIQDTVPLAPMDAMQYRKALDRIVREIKFWSQIQNSGPWN